MTADHEPRLFVIESGYDSGRPRSSGVIGPRATRAKGRVALAGGSGPMYTPGVRHSPQSVALAACLSLLGLQLSGLHLHVNAEGFDPVPHGTHVHGIAHRHDGVAAHTDDTGSHDIDGDRHDHDGDRDVAAVELGTGAAKLPVFLVGDALELVANPPGAVTVRGDATTRPSARGIRWRPPLRGPPRLSV